MSLVIDSHQHFWQLGRFDYAWLDAEPLVPIRRDYLPSDLSTRMQQVGVHKSVFVQTQHNLEETEWVLAMAQEHEFIAGVVGWVDLASPQCEQQLLGWKQHPKFVGVRHVTHDEPDDDFIIRPDVMRGLAVLQRHGVPFDLLFYVKHLPHAVVLARRFPDLPLVIDHLAKPAIKQGRLDDWADQLRAAARCPNVYCKLSGMITEADWQHWKPSDLAPYVRIALDCFGAQRCMFGSDWPVCELAGTYQQVYRALLEALGPISDDDRSQIFGGTAARFYRLSL